MTNNPFYIATSGARKVSGGSRKGPTRKTIRPATTSVQRRVERHGHAARWLWGLCVVAVVFAVL